MDLTTTFLGTIFLRSRSNGRLYYKTASFPPDFHLAGTVTSRQLWYEGGARLAQLSDTRGTLIVIKYVILFACLFFLSLSAVAQDEDVPSQAVGTFGFGLESSGSACCISVRFWVENDRGSEMVISAFDTNLFVTLRGLQAVGRIDPVTAYTGLGMTLRFGDIVAIDPFSAFMAVQGFIALETPFPFYEALMANIEASVEIRPQLGFSTSLGMGVHFYF